MHSWPLLLPTFCLFAASVRSPLVHRVFLLHLLLLTHFGETPEAEIFVPTIFWHKLEDICKEFKLGLWNDSITVQHMYNPNTSGTRVGPGFRDQNAEKNTRKSAFVKKLFNLIFFYIHSSYDKIWGLSIPEVGEKQKKYKKERRNSESQWLQWSVPVAWTNCIVFLQKLIFGCFSTFYSQRSVTEAWTNTSPWCIIVYFPLYYLDSLFPHSAYLAISAYLKIWHVLFCKICNKMPFHHPPTKPTTWIGIFNVDISATS